MASFRKIIHLRSGRIEFDEFCALGYVKSNINFDEDDRVSFLNACLDHYNGHPFGYISVREHSYSINPMIYTELNKVESLKAFAIVSDTSIGRGNAEIEGKFYKKPFGIFGAKEDAIQWMNEEIIKAIEKE
mgnify:FL=1|tara:strand:+ start:1211 stop:1603 length:393 start_codon:yes stop_codon:yes gene_type:complete